MKHKRTCYSKVIGKVKVFKKHVKLQGQGKNKTGKIIFKVVYSGISQLSPIREEKCLSFEQNKSNSLLTYAAIATNA